MSCPYSDEELDYWDGVYNPMGRACYTCEWYECEHNANPGNDFPIRELETDMGLRASEEFVGSSGRQPKAPPEWKGKDDKN